HVNVIDCVSADVKRDQDVLIQNGRIKFVHPSRNAQSRMPTRTEQSRGNAERRPPNAERRMPTRPEQSRGNAGFQTIDGHGKYLIPGLWDMHVHGTEVPGFL